MVSVPSFEGVDYCITVLNLKQAIEKLEAELLFLKDVNIRD